LVSNLPTTRIDLTLQNIDQLDVIWYVAVEIDGFIRGSQM
jgi:hypothetical protein